jgi:putative addiction module component (TIGR02574 family)
MTIRDVMALSPTERAQFMAAVAECIEVAPETSRLSDAQRRELDAHLDAFSGDPDAGLSWAMLKTRIIPNA